MALNRRELLAAAVASAGVGEQVDADSIDVNENQEVICFVVRSSGMLSQQAVHNLSSCVKSAFANTKWRDTPVFALEDGWTFEAVLTPKSKLPGGKYDS